MDAADTASTLSAVRRLQYLNQQLSCAQQRYDFVSIRYQRARNNGLEVFRDLHQIRLVALQGVIMRLESMIEQLTVDLLVHNVLEEEGVIIPQE